MSRLRARLAELNKEAVEFCPDCGSMMKDEYCSNKSCDKSKDAEKRKKKDEKERKRYELENITYDNGEVGDSVLIKFINTTNGREYWSAQERKAKYPDSWVETKIHELQRQLETDDKRVPEEMRNDNKSGDVFTVEFEVYKGQGAFDHANNQLAELGEKAYHFMKKSPKNPHDPNLDTIMQDDELLIPTASLKRLIRKTLANEQSIKEEYIDKEFIFDPKDLKKELIHDSKMGSKIENYFYKECKIINLAVYVDDNFEDNYYNIEFSDGNTLDGISGYHLR